MSHHKQKEHNKPDNVQKNAEKEKTSAMPKVTESPEYKELWNKYLRVCADFDNAHKRWETQRREIIKFANFTLLKDFIVIIDELEQALKMLTERPNLEKIKEGIELTYNNFLNILKKNGVESIDAKGKTFNPHLEEIVAHKEIEHAKEPIVLEEVQKGYLLENKVLRSAKVIVGIPKKETGKEKIKETNDSEKKENQEEKKDEDKENTE